MDPKWDARQSEIRAAQPQRDFLAEATCLALQLDPVSWDFDLPDANGSNGPGWGNAHHFQYDNTALATGTVARDQMTAMGTQSMYTLYHPDTFPHQQNPPFPRLQPINQDSPASDSGSEGEQGFGDSRIGRGSGSSDLHKLGVRDKNKAHQRRWRHKHKQKERNEEQRRSLESLQQRFAELSREKAAVEAHADLLEKALMKLSKDNSELKPQAAEIPAFVPSRGWTVFDPRGSVVLSAVFDQPKTLTPKEAATISLRDHARLWTEYVVKAKECLQKTDLSLGPDCPHLKKLKALLDERHGFLSWTSANNLPMIHRLNTSNLECNRPLKAKSYSSKSFSSVLANLNLTKEQKHTLVESRNYYLLSIGFHSASLAQLQSQLMELDPTPRESLRYSPFLKWTELSRGLQESVEEIHLTHVRLHFEVYHGEQALSPYQAGTLLVECFPYIPDIIMLLQELASSQDAPSSKELLTKGALRYAEQQEAAELKITTEPYKPIVDKVSDLISKVELWEDSAGVS